MVGLLLLFLVYANTALAQQLLLLRLLASNALFTKRSLRHGKLRRQLLGLLASTTRHASASDARASARSRPWSEVSITRLRRACNPLYSQQPLHSSTIPLLSLVIGVAVILVAKGRACQHDRLFGGCDGKAGGVAEKSIRRALHQLPII